MASNCPRGVVYLRLGSAKVQKIDFPTFRNPAAWDKGGVGGSLFRRSRSRRAFPASVIPGMRRQWRRFRALHGRVGIGQAATLRAPPVVSFSALSPSGGLMSGVNNV